MNDLTDMLRSALKKRPVAAALDSACGGDKKEGDEPTFDSAATYAETDLSLRAIANIHQWAETDDLDDGETYSDRLLAMMVGLADANKDGEITDDEQEVLQSGLNSAWDYLSSLGASDEDLSALLNDWDMDAAERIRDLVASVLPEGEDAASEAIDSFVFGPEDQEPALDAVYRKAIVIRKGKKTRINKRIAGTVRLSAKQKLAIRKASMKSHSATAQAHRMKSMRMRKSAGM